MAIAVRRTRAAQLTFGSALRRRPRRKRPYRAAVRAALQVGLVVVIGLVATNVGVAHSVAQTMLLGAAALLYVMAEFALELPVDP